jgi:hypothetical protein
MRQLTVFDSSDTPYSLQQLRDTHLPHTALRYASLHLDASKTDPFRTGVDVVVAATHCAEHALHIRFAMLACRRPSRLPAIPLR